MPPIKLTSDAQWDENLAAAGDKLVVVDFTATWCGPCRRIGPYFDKYADVYTDAVFLKVDVDALAQTAQKCGISCMPTFQFYKNAVKVDEFSGAVPARLEEFIKKHL